MIKIDYVFKAKTPIHTGSDENAGTIRTLRRFKILLPEKQVIESRFDKKERIEIVTRVLSVLYNSIDKDSFSKDRLKRIWEEFYTKIKKGVISSKTKEQFIESFCKSFGIKIVYDVNVLEDLKLLSDFEFFETIKENLHYLVLRVRKEKKEKKETVSLFEEKKENKKVNVIEKIYDYIPVISGNSIRGVLRRIAMYDFFQLLGVQKVDKSIYHMLFTGGVLSDSNPYEDIEKREKLIEFCPMLGLFGSAIGTGTIEGQMLVSHAFPLCKEIGTGDMSYWDYLDIIFQTRLDSEKTEKELEIIDNKKDITTQMKYEYEVFAKGTPFEHHFRVYEFSELIVSAFYRVMKLFKEKPFITAMGSVGNGEIDLTGLEIPVNGDEFYLKYIEENKNKIMENMFNEGKINLL